MVASVDADCISAKSIYSCTHDSRSYAKGAASVESRSQPNQTILHGFITSRPMKAGKNGGNPQERSNGKRKGVGFPYGHIGQFGRSQEHIVTVRE